MLWRTFVAALALTAVQAAPTLAAAPQERVAARQAVEKQIRDVDARLARLADSGAPSTSEQERARRWNAAARELLKLGNTRAAATLAGHARRELAAPAVPAASPAPAVQP